MAIVDRRFRTGDVVALRELWSDSIWYARPAIVVLDADDLTMFHVPAGVTCREPVDDAGRTLRVYTDEWRLADTILERSWSLSFAIPGLPYGVILQFEPGSDRFLGYYVNLESPLARTEVGFDYVDHLLDVRIAPDRSSWAWKDEDELDEAVDRALFTADHAASLHHWGERAVEHVLLREPPFDREWSSWRPDPAWDVPELPTGWDTAPVSRRTRPGEVLGPLTAPA